MKSYLDPRKCSTCSKHPDLFVPPEIPRKPQLIAVGEAPAEDEFKQQRPFVGASGKKLRGILPVPTIIVNSMNLYLPEKPTTAQINGCREGHLLPILAAYPDLPVVSLGKYAAQAVMGGKHGDSSMAGQVLWLHDRVVTFTYHPAYYFHQGRDERILQHIEAMVKTAIAPPLKLKIVFNKIPCNREVGPFTMDLETTSSDLPFYGSTTVLLGIMPEHSKVAYQYTADWLAKKTNIAALQKWIDGCGQVIGHNLMFDVLHAEALGLRFDKVEWFDTMLHEKDKGHDLFEGFGLKGLAHRLYYAPAWEAKWSFHMKAKTPVEQIPMDIISPYNAGDLYYTLRLAEARRDPDPMFRLDMDYMPYIKEMVQNGLNISKRKLASMLKTKQAELSKAESKGRRMLKLGKDFNYSSWQQVLPVLQRIVSPKITSTKEQVLEQYVDKHKFVPLLLKQRGLKKQVGMLTGIEKRIVPVTKLVHTTATVHGAETSRTSTKDPNIQNWPEEIRPMVVSRYPKGKIIYPDLSQLEYRLIAHETGEPILVRTFREGGDIHSGLGKLITGKEPKDKKERKIWKTANYASIYGTGFKKFMYLTELPLKKAKEIFYGKLAGLYRYIDDYKAELEERLKYDNPARIYNIFGRVRYMSLVEFGGDLNAALREAFNWIFQSSGHDVLKLWTMECMDMIDDPEILFVDDLHDEFVLDCPEKKVKRTIETIEFVSANINLLLEDTFGVKLKVPMEAEIDVDIHWS